MKQSVHVLVLWCVSLLVLPGCGRIVDWAKESFYQGEELENRAAQVKNYVRSVRLYDKLVTRASFDALWLSDEVRRLYTDMYIQRRGKSQESYQAVLRRQLEENNHFISFYVLSLDRYVLGDEMSAWSLFLEINGQRFTPIEIKWVETSPEIMRLFGKKWNRFKTAYQVRFNAKDTQDRFLISPDTQQIKLYVRSVDKEAILVWDLQWRLVDQEQCDDAVDVGGLQ